MSDGPVTKQVFGRYGAWTRAQQATPGFAVEIERMGYPALWVGGSPPGDLALVEELLDATGHLLIATGIVNIWSTDPETLAASYHRIERSHPGRFVLGLGVGHPEGHGDQAKAPFAALERFLDGLDDLAVPVSRRLLAALGPRMLSLSAERSLGAHPYMTTPRHTSTARATLGEGALLAPEQRVVITEDRDSGFERARGAIARYLRLTNYRNSLLTMGYAEHDLEGEGSDRLISDLAALGDGSDARTAIDAHLEAGADHVAVQVFADSAQGQLEGFAALSGILPL